MSDFPPHNCLECDRLLVVGPSEEPYWCQTCFKPYALDDLERATAWRRMSFADRAAKVGEMGQNVIGEYAITQSQYLEVSKFIERRKGTLLESGNVSPDKQALLSLSRGITDAGALREMIDNSMDCARRKRDGAPVTVEINLDTQDGSVIVRDDAGGMSRTDMLRCLRLGSISPDGHVDDVIGRFGVGAKEAIFHFGREVTITSCEVNGNSGIETFVPSSWFDVVEWNVDIIQVPANPGVSTFRISVLKKFEFGLDTIKAELWASYKKRIRAGRLTVLIDGNVLQGAPEPALLYPPQLFPRRYRMQVAHVMVDVDVSMLRDEPTASGIFFYAFGRQYAHWAWDNPMTKTLLEKTPQHQLNRHFRLELDFSGKIEDIPINANKDKVELNSHLFNTLSKVVNKIAHPYLSSISWLSQAGNMRYMDRFAGVSNRHSDVSEEKPLVELGRVYDSSIFPKTLLADFALMVKCIDKDRLEGDSSQLDTTHVGITASVQKPTRSAGDKIGQKASRSDDGVIAPQPTPKAASQEEIETDIRIRVRGSSATLEQLKSVVHNAVRSSGVTVIEGL